MDCQLLVARNATARIFLRGLSTRTSTNSSTTDTYKPESGAKQNFDRAQKPSGDALAKVTPELIRTVETVPKEARLPHLDSALENWISKVRPTRLHEKERRDFKRLDFGQSPMKRSQTTIKEDEPSSLVRYKIAPDTKKWSAVVEHHRVKASRSSTSLQRLSKPGNARAFTSCTQARSVTEGVRDYGLQHESLPHQQLEEAAIIPNKPDIRQRLKDWEQAREQAKLSILTSGRERVPDGTVNELSQPESDQTAYDAADEETSNDMLLERNDFVDFGDNRSFMLKGDMVELRFGASNRIELAFYIRSFKSQAQFYTMSGRWIQRQAKSIKFFVPRFIDPGELDPLIPFLPEAEVPSNMLDKLHPLENSLPRRIGAPLISKMMDFWKQADDFYRANASNLDNAHEKLALPNTRRVASLLDLAGEILPVKYMKHGQYPGPLLFAFYRSLRDDHLRFNLRSVGGRSSGLIEIVSREEINTIEYVCEEVRKYQELQVSPPLPVKRKGSTLLAFITKARNLIDQSRILRDVTPYGMLGPIKPGNAGKEFSNSITPFTECDAQYLRFFESWTALQTFDEHSPESSIASTILCATRKYEGMELGPDTGWIFLQELGAISPFASLAAFRVRLPATSRLLPPSTEIGNSSSTTPDIMGGMRKDWGEMPVYCIDDVGAKEIDDGVSIERAENPEEYWVHIHTANPGSQIAPGSDIATAALARASNMYFPERVINMLPSTLVKENFSLARDRPSLTFSARVNLDKGVILEKLVTPGTLRNVIYLTRQTVSEIVDRIHPKNTELEFTRVGNWDYSKFASEVLKAHPVIQKHQLSAQDAENLKLLKRLSIARETLAAAKGATTPAMQVALEGGKRSSYRVSAYNCPQDRVVTSTTVREYNDPAIELSRPKQELTGPAKQPLPLGEDIVKNLMLMGGEIAARWCHERGIPIIYRVSQRNDGAEDPAEYYRRKIMPRLRNNVEEEIPDVIFQEYTSLLGHIQASTTAGPHSSLGMDMFARSTSPLRRFSDLLLQWQVQAALLEEAQTRVSLIGASRDDFLPFSKFQIDGFLYHLSQDEREVSRAQHLASTSWLIQLLVRAWKYKETKIPATFEFKVIGLNLNSRALGVLPYFGNVSSLMQYPKWLRVEDIRPDDVFEVEIHHLNAYKHEIIMKPLRRIGIASKDD